MQRDDRYCPEPKDDDTEIDIDIEYEELGGESGTA